MEKIGKEGGKAEMVRKRENISTHNFRGKKWVEMKQEIDESYFFVLCLVLKMFLCFPRLAIYYMTQW